MAKVNFETVWTFTKEEKFLGTLEMKVGEGSTPDNWIENYLKENPDTGYDYFVYFLNKETLVGVDKHNNQLHGIAFNHLVTNFFCPKAIVGNSKELSKGVMKYFEDLKKKEREEKEMMRKEAIEAEEVKAVKEAEELNQGLNTEEVETAKENFGEDIAKAGNDPEKLDKLSNKFKKYFAQALHTIGRITGLTQLRDSIKDAANNYSDINEIAKSIRILIDAEYEEAEFLEDEEKEKALQSLFFNSEGELLSIFELVLKAIKWIKRKLNDLLLKFYNWTPKDPQSHKIGLALLNSLRFVIMLAEEVITVTTGVIGGIVSYIVAGVTYVAAKIWNICSYIFNSIKTAFNEARNGADLEEAVQAAVDIIDMPTAE